MTFESSLDAAHRLSVKSDLVRRVGDYRSRMLTLVQQTETALDTTRDRYGRNVHADLAAAAVARRNKTALETYTTYLASHTEELLAAAERALDVRPAARHTTGWRSVLHGLGTSASEIRRALDRPAAPGTTAEHTQHAALWPHLAAWADHALIASSLLEHHPSPQAPLTGDDQRQWTEAAAAARRRGDLDLIESWYAADGRLISLAHLIEDDDSTVIALEGTPDTTGWRVIGQFAHEYEAGRALPAPVPPGVLRADASRFTRPEPVPEVSLQELVQDVVEAQSAGDASNALLTATQRGYAAGPVIRLQELLGTTAQFAGALEAPDGQQIAVRLAALSRQLEFLATEVHDAAEDLGATVAVLPPHRTPRPRARPRPAVDTTPPTPPPRAATAAHLR
ncbi:hypothetical protein [Streptomyces seoulensis]|uniref:hypothetical protein n=1 Tax=Streptomyces seoulensis TaxID=73044 RepID=UPI001FCCBDB1|nr:hypothetical protein [Streptomyces seoulensis]BDH07211.1 hypothetical protein HEK131_44380 [Streptomyces seoulensis]